MSNITTQMVDDAMDNEYDGIESCVLVQELLELKAELDKHHWIPVAERPPQDKEYHYSAFYVVTDSIDWTIAHYHIPYERWETVNSPYDLDMLEITHWKPMTLPKVKP